MNLKLMPDNWVHVMDEENRVCAKFDGFFWTKDTIEKLLNREDVKQQLEFAHRFVKR